jgi:hypothetical protein
MTTSGQSTPASSVRPGAVTGSGGYQTASGMQTAVQLTFSFEIASLQLTPSFKMAALQLKPTSKLVTMRLAPSQQPQPAMNLQVTFEIATVQATGGGIGQIRLTPSQQQRPSVISSPAFNIAGLQLLSGTDAGAVQLTPSQQGQASVHVTGKFQIATVEFSPSFEIASIVLTAISNRVSVQLPGAGVSAVEGAPVFEIASVHAGFEGIEMLRLVASSGHPLIMQTIDVPTVLPSATIYAPTVLPPTLVPVGPGTRQPAVQLPPVATAVKRSVQDLAPFLAMLATSGVSSSIALLPRLAISLALPAVPSIDDFVERAVSGELTATIDVSAWTDSSIAELDRCVFLALYQSGIVRPITVEVTQRGGRTLLTLTDPVSFFDPALEGQELPAGPLRNAFDLVAMRLARE